MILEPFSAAYYLGVADLIDYRENGAVVATDVYDDIIRHVYASERFDLPLLAKIGPVHVPVRPESGVPVDTVAVGPDLLDLDIHPTEDAEFLIARERTAEYLQYII